jgi:hypothetical protein
MFYDCPVETQCLRLFTGQLKKCQRASRKRRDASIAQKKRREHRAKEETRASRLYGKYQEDWYSFVCDFN